MHSPPEPDADTLAAICAILAGLLGTDGVDPGRGFRRLGGDSLRAVKAAGQIAAEFGTPDETNERLLEALLDDADAGTLARLIEDPGAATAAWPATEHGTGRVLSYGEERLWLAQRYYPGTAAYHVVNAFRIAGDLDLHTLDEAVGRLAERHPALRTRYDSQGRRVLGEQDATRQADILHYPAALPWPEAIALATADAVAPFDLAEGRLLRVRSYPVASGERLLLVVVHHIATDGWSMNLIYAELSGLYAGRSAGPVPPGYHEFAIWQRAAGAPVAAAEAFAARLGPLPGHLELNARRLRPPARSMAGSVLSARLPGAAVQRLQSLAAAAGSSLYAVLLTAFYLCLARRSRQWDLLLGMVASARTQPRFHHTVGFFASTLPVRVSAGPDTTIQELLSQVHAGVRWALAHQDAPLEEIAVRVRRSPDRAHAPLVDAVLILQDDSTLPHFPGCAVTPLSLHTGTAKFDLMLEASPAGGTEDLTLSWEYATDVLSGQEVGGLAASFDRIAASLAVPGATAGSAISLSDAERQCIAAVNDTARSWPQIDVSERFEGLARAGPGLPAVLDGPVTVDRAELRLMRSRLAGSLVARGVRPGDVVAIHLPRSDRSVAALLAAWWIGAVPLLTDIHHPADHNDSLVRSCRAAAVLTQNAAGWSSDLPVVTWADAVRPAPFAGPPARRAPDDAAWLVATSGSTGVPKLTAGTHRGLRNRCAWAWDTFPYTRSEVAALRTPASFVDAIAEAVVPLLAGVPLAIVPDRAVWDARELAAVLGRQRVTRLLGTPAMLRRLLEAVPDLGSAAPALRWCVSSGEPLDADLLGRLRSALPRCRIVNLYGSSEVAGDVAYADVTDLPAGQPVPIGRPIANARIVVADGDGELMPPGTAGELVVTGDPVGLGYLLDGRVTRAGGFRPAPGGECAYWTGDLGWLDPDGLLYYAGRRDRQVKVNGCRVELGQVEMALLALPGVGQAIAWTGPSSDDSQRICAAAAPRPGTTLSGAALRVQLRNRLPSYMVPARIVIAETLPLSANGKLDRAELARLAAQEPGSRETPDLPPLQQRLRRLWSGALGGELAGPDDDFFALGGDSLAANSMLAAVMRDTGVTLDLGDFLAAPTIRALAARLADLPGLRPAAGGQAR